MLDQLGFEKFDTNAEWTEFISLEKLCIAISWNVGGGFCGGVDGIRIRWRSHEGDYSGVRDVRQF